MNSRDLLELSWGNLVRRKTRTILSIVGVVVGTCAIVVMLSIGFGLSAGFQEEIESYGNLHTIQVYNWGGGGGGSSGQSYSLDDNTISKIGKIDGVTAITPIVNQYLTIGIGHDICQTSVIGIDPDVMDRLGYDIEQGRLLNSSDTGKNVLVFGKSVAGWFYNPRQQMGGGWGGSGDNVKDVISQDVTITGDWNYGTNNQGEGDIKYEYFDAEGIGLLATENDESAYSVYMPIDSLEKIVASIRKSEGNNNSPQSQGKKTYEQALIYAEDIDKIKGICETINDTYSFQTYSLNDALESMNEIALLIEGILGGIGAISLLVAAIGIANTMVMSVYERTKEIGVMKVIGASLRDIGNMFMVEAAMIGFIGGLAGVLISYGISFLMNTFLVSFMQSLLGSMSSTVSVIPIWVALAALGFATLMGLVSGYYPAKRAMNLSALEGLRNE